MYFKEAKACVDTGWVTLIDVNSDMHKQAKDSSLTISAPRGLDVQVSDIIWCADAPHGS